MPVEKIKDLQRLLHLHNEAARLVQNTKGGSKDIYDWHREQAEVVRGRLMARYEQVDKRQPTEAVRIARNARWRHTGAIGSIHWALGTLSGLASLPTTTDEARQLAQRIVNDLWLLKSMMGVRKSSK